jgi:hypothetical protein
MQSRVGTSTDFGVGDIGTVWRPFMNPPEAPTNGLVLLEPGRNVLVLKVSRGRSSRQRWFPIYVQSQPIG